MLFTELASFEFSSKWKMYWFPDAVHSPLPLNVNKDIKGFEVKTVHFTQCN